jgi:hypothetical protein
MLTLLNTGKIGMAVWHQINLRDMLDNNTCKVLAMLMYLLCIIGFAAPSVIIFQNYIYLEQCALLAIASRSLE